MQSNVESSLKSGMTEAKILVCENNCSNNTAVSNPGGTGTPDSGTRVITIIEATGEGDGNALIMNSNSVFGGVGGEGGANQRLKRGSESAALTGNETRPTVAAASATASTASTAAVTDEREASLTAEMLLADPSDAPKPVPIKRGTAADGAPQPDMTQAIMEQRVDYDVDDEFVAANGHGYDAPRTRPVNNDYYYYHRGYSHAPVADGEEEDHLEENDEDGGDHNSHYEYVPMEFDAEGNHR